MTRKTAEAVPRWREALNRLRGASVVGYDAETSGLDWKRNHIVGHVLSFGPAPQDSYYLPVRHAGGGNILNQKSPQEAIGWDGQAHPIEDELFKLLDRQNLVVFGHNLSFDLKFLWRHGTRTLQARYECTQVNAALINEWQGRFSLDFCATTAKVEAKKGDDLYRHLIEKFGLQTKNPREAMGHYWRLAGDDPIGAEYALGDGVTTWQLRDWQRKQIENQELQQVHDIESRLIPVLVRMTTRGIQVDQERVRQVLALIDDRVGGLMSAFPPDFNPRSMADVRAWCETNGRTDWPLTAKTRKPSFTEAWLSSHGPGQAVVAVRKLETLRSTFMTPLIERHMFKGRAYPEFHQLRNDEYGTITGRLSCSEPNLQAASKRNKELGRIHRSVFVADKGMEWTDADYSQCEPRVLAEYSGCKVLMDGYLATPPVDAHQAVANATGLDRETGKRVNQTLITGGGKRVIVERYGVDPQRVDEIWATYFRAMPEIRSLQKQAERVMLRRGYIRTLLGRRCRLSDPNKAYQALNRLLQGGNADIIKTSMVRIDEYLASEGRPVDMLNNVHDAISFQSRPEDRHHLNECLRLMCDFGEGSGAPIELGVPMVVDHDTGPDWATATYGEEKHGEKQRADTAELARRDHDRDEGGPNVAGEGTAAAAKVPKRRQHASRGNMPGRNRGTAAKGPGSPPRQHAQNSPKSRIVPCPTNSTTKGA